MSDFDLQLAQRLAKVRKQGLYRELRRIDSPQSSRITLAGKSLLNFSSNDYLGLANDPLLKAASIRAIEQYGAGAGSSRLICGSLAPHHQLEETLAAFKGAQAALSFATGYAAASGAICSIVGKDDVIVLDKLAHACIIDAARLSGAKLRVFAHNDLNELEDILKWADHRAKSPNTGPATRGRVLIATESVFSMDGDHAPLRELVELKERYGAWLMVDEAHATGLYGAHGRGLAEELGASNRIEIQMGTLGKALGASGGYLCGSRELIDFLINRARSFIFSTAPVPAAAAAATAAIRFVQSEQGEQRRNRLWQRVSEFAGGKSERSEEESSLRHATREIRISSAIIPLIVGDENRAVDAATALRVRGIFIPAIRYPTVARGQARLRLTLTAAHEKEDIRHVKSELAALGIGKSLRIGHAQTRAARP